MEDGADASGSDFGDGEGACRAILEEGDGAFILPEVGESAAQGDGGDGEEGAVDEAWCVWVTCEGEVEAVVVDGAESGAEQGSAGELFGKIF